MTRYYKAVRPNGRDFFSDSVQWAPETTKARKGRVINHPTSGAMVRGEWSTGLAASTDPAKYPGADHWPVRILEVEPVGEVHHLDQKAQALTWRVVAELNAAVVKFGPQGVHVAALIERAGRLTRDEASGLYAARYAAGDAARYAARVAARVAAGDAARDAARYAARVAAGDAARYAARDAARYAARDAARYVAWVAARVAAGGAARDAARYAAWGAAGALVVRDLIGQHGFTLDHYRTLVAPWESVIGKVHPDD